MLKLFNRTIMFYGLLDKILFSSEAHDSPFPSSGLPLSQNESSCKTFHMKMSLICMKMNLLVKHIFIRMVSHLDLF